MVSTPAVGPAKTGMPAVLRVMGTKIGDGAIMLFGLFEMEMSIDDFRLMNCSMTVDMCVLSLSLIQTGTNWFVKMPMREMKTNSDMIVPTVAATPSSLPHRGDFLIL